MHRGQNRERKNRKLGKERKLKEKQGRNLGEYALWAQGMDAPEDSQNSRSGRAVFSALANNSNSKLNGH